MILMTRLPLDIERHAVRRLGLDLKDSCPSISAHDSINFALELACLQPYDKSPW